MLWKQKKLFYLSVDLLFIYIKIELGACFCQLSVLLPNYVFEDDFKIDLFLQDFVFQYQLFSNIKFLFKIVLNLIFSSILVILKKFNINIYISCFLDELSCFELRRIGTIKRVQAV